jgi:hypothetical protein
MENKRQKIEIADIFQRFEADYYQLPVTKYGWAYSEV